MFSWHIIVKNEDGTMKDYRVSKSGKVENLEKPREKKRSIASFLSNLVGWNSAQEVNSIPKDQNSNSNQEEEQVTSSTIEESEYYPMADEFFYEVNNFEYNDMELNWSQGF